MSEFNLDEYLTQFESQGATLSRPVLNEGNYKANIIEVTTRTNKWTPDKGPNKGVEQAITSWGVKLALDSQTANEVLKQDGDVIVYADQDCETLRKGNLRLSPDMGIPFDGNIGFWAFIGSVFEQVELATKLKDDSGASSYKFEGTLIKDFYRGVKEKHDELMADSSQDEVLIPSKLAEVIIKNISELIASEADTRKCYVHMSHRADYRDKSVKQHYVRRIISISTFEERQDNIDSLIL